MKMIKELQGYQRYRSMRAIELFNLREDQLSIEQKKLFDQYLYDIQHPEWKSILNNNGTETEYEVSNTGWIRNRSKGIYTAGNTNRKGYLVVYIPNMYTGIGVHRLVAQAFIPNPENKPQVNHINGNKHCNWYKNLEWNTAEENVRHAIDHGLFYVGLGEKANASKYSDEQIHQVCKLLEYGKFLNTEIAKMTNVDVYTVSKVKCKEDWTHISCQYNIPKPVQNAVGSSAAASKYSDEQIHQVCKLLQEKTPMTAIEKLTGVGYDMIYRIKKGKNWSHISSQYGINKT